jgi:hypothetical protein
VAVAIYSHIEWKKTWDFSNDAIQAKSQEQHKYSRQVITAVFHHCADSCTLLLRVLYFSELFTIQEHEQLRDDVER